MRLIFTGSTKGKDPAINMEYDVNPMITMSTAKVYSKINLKGSGLTDKEEIFVPLNLYINSEQVPEKSRRLLYTINKAMTEIDLTHGDPDDAIRSYVNALTDLLNEPAFREDSILKWAETNLEAPPTAEETYDDSKEGRHSRFSTYLKDEYFRLMALTIFIRIAIFVLVALIRALGSKHDDKLKRFKALEYMPKQMKELPSYKRLYLYIKSFSDKVVIKAEDSLSLSFDDENKIDMLFSIVLFHVLITGRVVNIDENRHIVSLMYNKIAGDNALNAYSKSNINAKHVNDTTEEDNSSVFESYRSVADKSIAEQVNLSHLGNEQYLISTIGHLIDETEYRLTMKDIKNQGMFVNQIHLNLMHVILRAVIPSGAYPFISKADVKHLLVMSALLIKEKHPYLAVILLSNSRKDLKTDDSEFYLAPTTMSFNISPAIKKEVVEFYPLEGILHPSITDHPVIEYIQGISKACATEVWVVKPNRPWIKKSEFVADSIVKPRNNVPQLIWDLIQDSPNIISGVKTLE